MSSLRESLVQYLDQLKTRTQANEASIRHRLGDDASYVASYVQGCKAAREFERSQLSYLLNQHPENTIKKLVEQIKTDYQQAGVAREKHRLGVATLSQWALGTYEAQQQVTAKYLRLLGEEVPLDILIPPKVTKSENLIVWEVRGFTYRANNGPKQIWENMKPGDNLDEFFKNDPERRAAWNRGWKRADEELKRLPHEKVIAALVDVEWDKVRAHNKAKGEKGKAVPVNNPDRFADFFYTGVVLGQAQLLTPGFHHKP